MFLQKCIVSVKNIKISQFKQRNNMLQTSTWSVEQVPQAIEFNEVSGDCTLRRSLGQSLSGHMRLSLAVCSIEISSDNFFFLPFFR